MSIPAFTSADMNLVHVALRERFGREMSVEDVETEIRLNPADRELTVCPALYWEDDGCRFVVSKTGENSFRSMFFWSVKDRFATGKEEYDNLGDCLVTTLKMQEEAAQLRNAESGAGDSDAP
jgi:hypothetical protein